MLNNPAEKMGYVIVLQYLDPLKKLKRRMHSEIFETQEQAQEQMGIMATEAPKVMLYLVEIPLLDYRPQLIAVQ